MSKKFDMIQRTMGVLRFPGHVYISFLNHPKNILGSKREKNKNIQFPFSLSRKIRRSFKKNRVFFPIRVVLGEAK